MIAAPRRSRRMRTTCHSMTPATSPTPIRYTARHIASGVMAGVASSTTSAVHSASAGYRRDDLDRFARPDGDAQQRNDRRQEGRCEQVGPAPAEPHVSFEQDGVGRQQHAAASQHFEGVDGEGFHGGYFLALRMISRISSISRAGMFSWREKNDTSWASEPSK